MGSSWPQRHNYLPSMGPLLPGNRQLPPFSRHESRRGHRFWTTLTLLSHLVLGRTVYPGPSVRGRDKLSQGNTPILLFHSCLFLHWESMPCSECLLSLLAWLDVVLPLHHSIFVSNVWIVAVWIHTTGTSLQHFLICSDPMNHHFWGQRHDHWNYYLNLSIPYLFFRVSWSRCLVSHHVISACHLWHNREDTSILSSVTVTSFQQSVGLGECRSIDNIGIFQLTKIFWVQWWIFLSDSAVNSAGIPVPAVNLLDFLCHFQSCLMSRRFSFYFSLFVPQCIYWIGIVVHTFFAGLSLSCYLGFCFCLNWISSY